MTIVSCFQLSFPYYCNLHSRRLGALMDLNQLEALSTTQLLHLLWSIWFLLNNRLNPVIPSATDQNSNPPSSSSAPPTYSPQPPPEPPASATAATAAWLGPQQDETEEPPAYSTCGEKCRWCSAWCGRHKPYHSGHSCYKHRHWR